MAKIPIVDLEELSKVIFQENSDIGENICQQIEVALSQVGFVYLVNHGIPKEKIEKAFAVSKKFFELPDEIKKNYRKNANHSFHGYAEPGQELLNEDSRFELRETFDIPVIRSDVYPNGEVPEFKSTLLDLQLSCHPLIKILNIVLAKALKLENEEFFNQHSKWMDNNSQPSLSALRTLYYPKINEHDSIEAGTVRCAEHTDYGTLTLLFQDSIGGLEVKNADGSWIQATPIANSILVNTGDLLEFWSGGYFPATAHRVLIPGEELNKKVARQSIVYFVHPDNSAIVSPIYRSSQCPENSEKYQPISAGEHALRKLNATYQY